MEREAVRVLIEIRRSLCELLSLWTPALKTEMILSHSICVSSKLYIGDGSSIISYIGT